MTASAILAELIGMASEYSGQAAQPQNRLYGDLDINGADFLEFIVAVEQRYDVDLSWISPKDAGAAVQDPTIQSLADYVARQPTHR